MRIRTRLLATVGLAAGLATTVNATPADTYISQTQVSLCEEYGAEYGICPELLEAIIETESSGRMTATNGTCYGIAQINGAIWGYSHDTEEAQVEQMCKVLMEYLEEIPDIAFALDRYNGNSKAYSNFENGTISDYSEKVLNRAESLERTHGK